MGLVQLHSEDAVGWAEMGRDGSEWVGSGWVRMGWVGLDWVGSLPAEKMRWVELGWIGWVGGFTFG